MIKALICNFALSFADIEKQSGVKFTEYFAEDLALLAPLAADGLVDVLPEGLQVTPKGRLLIRNICMCFDVYMRQKRGSSSSRALFSTASKRPGAPAFC